MGRMGFGDREIIYQDDNFSLSVETIEECLFIHCVITKFNKQVLRDIKKKWAELLINVYMMGYEEILTYTRDMRLVKMIGGGEVVATYEDWSVVKWDLK